MIKTQGLNSAALKKLDSSTHSSARSSSKISEKGSSRHSQASPSKIQAQSALSGSKLVKFNQQQSFYYNTTKPGGEDTLSQTPPSKGTP